MLLSIIEAKLIAVNRVSVSEEVNSVTEGVVAMPGSIADIQGDIFYIEHRAPYMMTSSHVHGHVELNYLIGCSATYIVDGRVQKIPENRLALFWANMPHRLIALEGEGKLFNLYVPLPEFLQWSLSETMRQAVMNGQVLLANSEHDYLLMRLQHWFDDYQRALPELREIILGEIALLLKRISIVGWESPRAVESVPDDSDANLQWSGDHPGSGRVKGAHHVSTMVHFIGENLHNPISTADVANHLGLHRNYTTNLFSSVMGVSIKQYLQFQRLQKAQLLLLDSERPIGEIGFECGFSSLSRFYEAFQRYFGMPPGQFRKKLL
ncbi:helix-turn-helix domain-containing protein [Endozoicomonas ascidiicola]|uniref:helix-turn-helix domain-containing protein n=1 Tax=Endozoicomonas ascidiicola TaxID=1698521 RepID=UPI00082DACD9|nr:helix-turn-helix domain-containing protein [Endozoicomonas ascidiicola]